MKKTFYANTYAHSRYINGIKTGYLIFPKQFWKYQIPCFGIRIRGKNSENGKIVKKQLKSLFTYVKLVTVRSSLRRCKDGSFANRTYGYFDFSINCIYSDCFNAGR